MKAKFILLFIFCHGFVFAGHWSASYFINADSVDPSVPKTETRVEVKFVIPDGRHMTGNIALSVNGQNSSVKLNSEQKIMFHAKTGKCVFAFYYNGSYNEAVTDSILLKGGHRLELVVNFTYGKEKGSAYTYKPVIYVYSTTTMQVNIKLDLKGELDFTYPSYNNGWDLTSGPDGKIKMKGRTYDYLFWDGVLDIQPGKDWNCGFEVSSDSLTGFFEKNLSAMGLSEKEMEDFITFWVPKMKGNDRCYIHFLFNEDYNTYARLSVTPQPDKLFRVFMVWREIGDKEDLRLQPQQIPSFQRSGFTVVEWGGAELGKPVVK
jgi:hypothetical protein